MRSKQYKFTIEDIAKDCHLKPTTVRLHRKAGGFDPNNLLSMAMYVVGHNLVKSCRKGEEETEGFPINSQESLDLLKGMIDKFGGSDGDA